MNLDYKSIFDKALFLNKLDSFIYLLTIWVVLWPVIVIMLFSSAPEPAATVANPDLKLCPEYFFGSNPAAYKYFFIKIATILSEMLKTKPHFNLEISIQFFKKITGQKLFSLK